MTGFLNFIKLKPSTIMFLVMGTLLGALFFKAVAKDPGYVLLAHGRHTLESSLLVGLLFFAVVGLLLYGLWRFLQWVFDSERTQRTANRLTKKGLTALAYGEWATAEKLMAKAAQSNGSPLINYLAAAQAAHEQGRFDARDNYLKIANQRTSDFDAAVSLTKARLQYQSEQWEECLATLMRLSENTSAPTYPFTIKMLTRVYTELGDWDKLRGLLPDIKRYRVLTVEDFERVSRQCYLGMLRRAERKDDPVQRATALQGAWHQIPSKFHTEPELVKAYSQALIEVGAGAEADNAITDALRKQWDDELVVMYGVVPGGDAEKQLLWCEKWLQERPNNHALLLTIGRLNMRLQRIEPARQYLESSIKSRQTAVAYAELGRLLSIQGHLEQANECLIKGLTQMPGQMLPLSMPTAASATPTE